MNIIDKSYNFDSKQHPALTLTGWQIIDTRDAVVDSLMPRSDTKSEHSEQSSYDILMQDEGHVSDLEDTDNAHIPKVSTNTWLISMDKTKITRKQSKASKHGHENQKSIKPKPQNLSPFPFITSTRANLAIPESHL
ncbi:hypothetical protein Tco_0014528 [Tanacetum coccineum]